VERIIACKVCGRVHRLATLDEGTVARCTRCDSVITRRPADSIARTAAFSLAALILFIPANLFPILEVHLYGAQTNSTVWDGCVKLYQAGDPTIAIIVFMASIFVPLLKLLSLFILVVSIKMQSERARMVRTWMFWFVDIVGRWAMLDVFVLAILVSVVKLQDLATILPGPGIFAFGLVVVFTLLASQSFDPQLIWDKEEQASESTD